jgi:hypothetical protein
MVLKILATLIMMFLPLHMVLVVTLLLQPEKFPLFKTALK